MFELNLKKNAKIQKESNGGTKLNKIIKQFPRVNYHINIPFYFWKVNILLISKLKSLNTVLLNECLDGRKYLI